MATTVRVKRKKSSGNEGVTLKAGEPYYNLKDKTLFVGASDNENVVGKKHVAQITNLAAETGRGDTIKFRIGENTANEYEQTINGVANATNAAYAGQASSVVLSSTFYGRDNPDNVAALDDAADGTVYIQIQ